MGKEKRTKSHALIALGLVVFTVNLGSVVDVFGIKLSWIASLALLLIYVVEERAIRFTNQAIKLWFIFFATWAIYGGIQTLFAKDFYLSFSFYMVLLINLFICVFMILLIRSQNDFIFILNIFTLSFFVNIIAAYYELFTGTHIVPIYRYQIMDYMGRVGGFVGNYNDFCTFLFIAIVIFLVQFSIVQSKGIKMLMLLGIGTSIHLIYVNGARGGIYAVWILLLTIPLMLYNKQLRKSPWRYVCIISFGGLLIIFTVIYLTQTSLNEMIASLGTAGDYHSDMLRVHLLKDGIKAFFNSFGLGIGAGQSLLLNNINIHNFYIEILCEYGAIFGMGACILAFIIPFQYNERQSIFVNSLLQATAVALIVANVTSSSSNKMRAMWVFLMLILLIKKTDAFPVQKETYKE